MLTVNFTQAPAIKSRTLAVLTLREDKTGRLNNEVNSKHTPLIAITNDDVI